MIYCNYPGIISAGMVELADTMDLGSIGQPCRFKSCYPHQLAASVISLAVSFSFHCRAYRALVLLLLDFKLNQLHWASVWVRRFAAILSYSRGNIDSNRPCHQKGHLFGMSLLTGFAVRRDDSALRCSKIRG